MIYIVLGFMYDPGNEDQNWQCMAFQDLNKAEELTSILNAFSNAINTKIKYINDYINNRKVKQVIPRNLANRLEYLAADEYRYHGFEYANIIFEETVPTGLYRFFNECSSDPDAFQAFSITTCPMYPEDA